MTGGSSYERRKRRPATRDDPAHRRRVVAGDFLATSGRAGRAETLAGLSVASNFALVPNFRALPGLAFSGVADVLAVAVLLFGLVRWLRSRRSRLAAHG